MSTEPPTSGQDWRRLLEPFELRSNQELQHWLASEFDVREELYELMGDDPGIYPESLDAVERFLLEQFPAPVEELDGDDMWFVDAAARHVGLVLVLGVDDAKWTIDLDDTAPFPFLPVVRGAGGMVQCPLVLVLDAIGRRSGHVLRDVADRLGVPDDDATDE